MNAVAEVKLPRQAPPRSSAAPIWALAGLPPRALASRVLFFTLILSVSIISGICLVNAIRWINKPFVGFLMNERMVPGNIGQYHWTGTHAGLTNQDKILTANDTPISSMRDLNTVIQRTNVGDPINYSLLRGEQIIEVTIPTMRFTWLDFAMTFAIPFLSGIVFLIIGVVVFILKPDTQVSWAFLLCVSCMGVFAITTFDIQSTHWGFIRTFLISNTYFAAALVHLGVVFPERKKLIEQYPSLQWAPYILSTILVVPLELAYPHPLFLQIYKVVLTYIILGATTLVASSLVAYFKKSSILASQRAKVVLFGAAVAFLFPAVAYYFSMFGGTWARGAIQNNLLAIPLMIFPASIAFAIAKHNLFDVDVYIKRAVGYGVMTAILGVTYLSMQTLMNAMILTLFGEGGEKVGPILFAVFVVLFFNPVNRKVQETIDTIFFRKKFDYKQTVSAVSNALTSMLNLDQIVKQVVHTIRKEMFIDTAGVIVLEPKTQTCWTFFVGDQSKNVKDDIRDVPIAYDDLLVALIREQKALITKYDVEEDPRYEDDKETCGRTFSFMAASVALPLLYQGEVTGILALGEKKSGTFYTREDIDLLNTMTNQAAVAIQNATTHEEVVRYAEELATSLRRIQILESIKTNLAKFVPKTVQDLIEESPEAPSFEKREADVSVAFADITGYTRLSALMELDQVNRLVERYFGAFLDEIVKYGGDVNETVGDGLMVIFRDPDPQRHARAAVLAALGIQRRTAEINAQLQGQFEPIAMHVGVNSGNASVGATKIEGAAGTRWTYTASGPTTNVAARLAALGEGGAVILSEETRQRLGDEFDAEDLGPQSLKNVAQPVRVYRITAKVGEPVAAGAFAERRRHPRQPVSWPVRLWIGQESFEGRTVDASVYGVCVASVPIALLEVGKSYRLEILTRGEGEIPCVAEVRNVTHRGIGLETKEALPVSSAVGSP